MELARESRPPALAEQVRSAVRRRRRREELARLPLLVVALLAAGVAVGWLDTAWGLADGWSIGARIAIATTLYVGLVVVARRIAPAWFPPPPARRTTARSTVEE